MASEFSEDGKYFAQISSDGKLKVWNTLSNSLDQEFTPDFHLTTPCTCLHFWQTDQGNNKRGSPSPKKKKRKDEPPSPHIILGTTSGIILVYSIAKASIDYSIDSKTNSQVNCLSISNGNLLYSGADQNILKWNLKSKELSSNWKGGNEIISSILSLSDGKHILTASKNIKLWDAQTKEVLKTFTGHSSDIIIMRPVDLPGADTYLLTGAKADRLLSCWNITGKGKQKNAVCNYLMEDVVQSVCINISEDGLTSLAATNRCGAVHIYQHKLNGKCDKPIKPTTSIKVVSDTGQSSEPVAPIRIFGARFLDSQTLCIGHGSEFILTFENLVLTSKKVEVLLRTDPYAVKKSKEAQVTKVKKALVGDDVNYVASYNAAAPSKRKAGLQEEIPMEQRLENLTLSKSESKVPRTDNVAQLLLQGLHSKDKSILRTALCRKDENVIRNTVKRLPVTVFEPLVAELSTLLRGKTVLSHFGVLWLKHLSQVHAGVLISNPNLSVLFSGVLRSIQARIDAQTSLNRLKGKLELLVPQIVSNNDGANNENDEALLVFNDKDSSDSESEDGDMQIEIPSDSEPENWDENNVSDEEMEQENQEDDSSDSGSVIMVNDDSDDSS